MTTDVPAFRTTVQRSGRTVVLCAFGELDLATAPALREAVREAVRGTGGRGGVALVVDLAGVSFVDASGLSALLQSAEALRTRGGDLHLAHPPRLLRRMLTLLDLEQQLPVAGG